MNPHLSHNIEHVGYHDLDGRPAFKLAMQEVPEHVAFLPGPDNTWTIQVQDLPQFEPSLAIQSVVELNPFVKIAVDGA